MKWIPLSKIAHGIAIYPFSPADVQQSMAKRKSTVSVNSNQLLQSDNASIHTMTSTNSSTFYDQPSTNPEDYQNLISLEVGDEIFVVEQQGQWYRGYVLSTLEEGRKPNKAPIGCFPRSHVQIKEYVNLDLVGANALTFGKHDATNSITAIKTTKSHNTSSESFINNAIPRSYSEPYIPSKVSPQLQTPNNNNRRPGSFNEYSLDVDTSSATDSPEEATSQQQRPPPPLPLQRYEQSTITGNSEPLIDEIAACISEWNSLLYTYIKERRYDTFNKVKDRINYLFQARRQLLDQALSREELTKLRREIIHKMTISNLEQDQDMLIRHPEKGYLLEPSNASLSTIYRMHWRYATKPITSPDSIEFDGLEELLNNSNSSDSDLHKLTTRASSHLESTQTADGPTKKGSEATNSTRAQFYHLFFELKACVAHICQPGEYTELYFSIYSDLEHKFITEKFVVVLNYNGMPKDEAQIGKLQTVFSEIPVPEFKNDSLHIVCHVIRLGSLKSTIDSKDHLGSFVGGNTSQLFHGTKHSNQSYIHRPALSANNLCRRPFGCAVLKLNHRQLTSRLDSKQATALDFDIPIYIPTNEANFVNLHENIILNHSKDFVTHPRAEKLRISLRTFYGCLATVLKGNSAFFQDISQTRRLGFADVAFPNDNRNDLYVTLELGDLAQLGKSRNIQVSIYVRDNFSGEVVENAISLGAGAYPVSFWESMVIYHEQKPRWNELIKINIKDVQQWKRSHLFITVKHRSSHGSNGGNGHNIPGFKKFSSHNNLNYHFNQKNEFGSIALGNEKILAMGFVPLFLPPLQREFIADGSHTLFLYKYDKQYAHPRFYLNSTAWCAKSSASFNTQQLSRERDSSLYDPVKNASRASSTNGRPPHHRSSSHHSLKSNSSSFTSSATAFNTTASASTSSSDLTGSHFPQQSYSSTTSKLTLLRDSINISTFLCSNRFTQNRVLVKVLNWKSVLENPEDGLAELLAVLDQFMFIGETEVVKFLGLSLDALLDILGYQITASRFSGSNNELVLKEIHNQAFASIVWLLGIVQDRRFSNFRPVLNVYLKHRFQSSATYNQEKQYTYTHLINCLAQLLENPEEPSKAKLLRSSMKVWEHLFRFIVQSRLCHQENEAVDKRSENNSQFFTDIEQLLTRIGFIMDPTHPNVMIGTQTITLQHFSEIINELYKIFDPRRLMEMTVAFIDHCNCLTGKLVGYKLTMIRNIVKGPVFDDPSCKPELSKHVLRWIKLWINSYMLTAKDVIFARKGNQALDRLNTQQTRLPRNLWIENLRLSLTIMSELLDRIRKDLGMIPSGLTLSCIPSPSASSSYSRPTSFAPTLSDQMVQLETSSYGEFQGVIQECLAMIPQLMNAYKDLQKLTIQAIHISGSSTYTVSKDNFTGSESTTPTHSRRQSRQSLSPLRERSSSTGSSTGINVIGRGSNLSTTDSLQTASSGHLPQRTSSLHKTATLHQMGNFVNDGTIKSSSAENKSAFTVILKALSTSPTVPFPSSYPFQPTVNNNQQKYGLAKSHDAMLTTGLFDLVVVFLDLLYLAPQHEWVAYIREIKEKEGITSAIDFLMKVIHTCMGILFGDNVAALEDTSLMNDNYARVMEDTSKESRRLPEKWLNLNAIAYRVILCNILEPISFLFELPEFIPNESIYAVAEDIDIDNAKNGSDFRSDQRYSGPIGDDYISSVEGQTRTDDEKAATNANSPSEQKSLLHLWRMYCVALLRIIGCPRMEVPEFMPQRQRAVWKTIGNMRSEVGAKVFLFLWDLAGRTSRLCTFDKHLSRSPTIGSIYSSTQQLSDCFGSDYFTSLVSAGDQRHFSYDDKQRKSIQSIDEMREDNVDNYPPGPSSNIGRKDTYHVRNSMRIWPTDNLLPSVSEEQQQHQITQEKGIQISLLQADLAYFIISPLLGISLTLHENVRAAGLSVIADIIALELYNYGELYYAQHVLISTLDRLVMSEHKGDESICTRISVELSSALDRRLLIDNRSELVSAGKIAVESLCKFLSLLFQIRELPQEEEFMDERITATLKILKFIQLIEREEIYIKYIHQLVQLHLDSNNYIEAALTLKYHADLLQWDAYSELPAVPELKLPAQSSFNRKESLYMKMLNYCDKGSAWELCVQLCKELAYEYENTAYDYMKLADILQRQSVFVKNISRKERCFIEYFRVGFYGKGFPRSSRNCQYIYRGLEWEKISSFIERLQNRHPNAQLLPAKIANTEFVSEEQLKELNSTLDGQFLQITPVTPVPDSSRNPMLRNPLVPDSIKTYYASNDVSKFTFSRPIVKKADNNSTSNEPELDFLNLWTEKVELECEDIFPTIVRRSQVIKTSTTLISPIENAVDAIEAKNQELISLERKYSAYIANRSDSRATTNVPPVNVNPFSMSVNGAVDAPINGGVPLYKKAFLTKEFKEANPEMRQWIQRLKAAIHDQVIILQKCLDTHSKVVSNEMKPLHNTMVELFKKNFAAELKAIDDSAAKELKGRPSVTTTSTNHRRSTLSSSTFDNLSMSELASTQPTDNYINPTLTLGRQNTSTQHTLPALPVMSPISRAFSIQALTLDSPSGIDSNTVSNNGTPSFDKASTSRAENFSRSLKLSLNKKARKKSKSVGTNAENS